MMPDVSERDPVEVLAEEYMDRQRRHEHPTVDEYASQYPDLAEQIRRVFPALQLLEEFKPEISATRNAEPLPTRLGEFRIVRLIGRGGMGVVYEAIQETLDRRVALKVLPADLGRDPSFQDRFRREARTAARLHHTNIVAVHGAGQADGHHFLVMQLINGTGLDSILATLRGKPLPIDTKSVPSADVATKVVNGVSRPNEPVQFAEANSPLVNLYHHNRTEYYRSIADLMAQVADAIAYAHEHGVVHRDVKPANILLCAERSIPGSEFRPAFSVLGTKGELKPMVADFGLAKAEGNSDLTRSGFVVGTPRYVAPERFNGDDKPAGDVFALGATLYELLTLKPAFDATSRERLIDQIQKSEPVTPSALDPNLPRDLETITLKALAKNPSQRYCAAELADDLRRWLENRPIKARRVGPIEKLVAWSRRNPVVAGLTAGLFLTLMTGLIVSLVLWRSAEGHRVVAENNLATAKNEWQRAENNAKEADRQGDDAERALSKSLDALDEFFQKVSQEKLLDVPGLQPLRRDLLVSALNYYQGFSEHHANDPRLRRETARAFLNAGRLQGMIGAKAESRPLIERAYRAFQGLITEFPDDIEVCKGMFRTCEAMAVLRMLTHDQTGARQMFIEASKQASRLSDNDSRYSTAWYRVRAAEMSFDLGQYELTLGDLRTARRQLEEMLKDQPNLIACVFALSRADTITASVLRELQRPDALRFAQLAHEKMQQVIKTNPEHVEHRREMARALLQLAVCEGVANQFNSAREHFDESRALMTKLVEENPKVRDFSSALASDFRQSAKIERGQQRLDEAVKLCHKAQDILERLEADDPNDSAVATAKAENYFDLGLAFISNQQFDEALANMQQARDKYTGLLLRNPQLKYHRCNLGACFGNIAYISNVLDHYEDAMRAAQTAIGYQCELLKDESSAPRATNTLLVQHYGVLFTALRGLHRFDELESFVQEYASRFSNVAGAQVRAAQEYCHCLIEKQPEVGPPSDDQIEQNERLAQLAIAALRKAIALSEIDTKKIFPQPQFRVLEGRADYQETLAALKTPS